MNAAAPPPVESLIARCLLDGEFLRDAAVDPATALAERDLPVEALPDLAALDIARVRQFAGFITKVQHNHLWELLPYTRALMKHYRIEIEVFAAYHPRHLDLRAQGASRAERIDAFLAFLDDFVAERDAWPGLRDVLRHERIMMELRAAVDYVASVSPALVSDSTGGGSAPFATLVPTVRGLLRVASFQCGPLEIAAAVSSGGLAGGGVSARPVCLVYSLQPAARRIRVLEVDDVTAALLAQVDGRRSVRAVGGRAAGWTVPRLPVSRLRPIFDAAAEAGLLVLRPPAGGA